MRSRGDSPLLVGVLMFHAHNSQPQVDEGGLDVLLFCFALRLSPVREEALERAGRFFYTRGSLSHG